MALGKILPITTLVFGGYMGKAQITEQVKRVADISRVIIVQQEVNDLSRIMYLDRAGGSQLPDPNEFPKYARANLKMEKSQRDTSKDLWGNSYKLVISNNRVYVVSAGPDGQFGDNDDVYASFGQM